MQIARNRGAEAGGWRSDSMDDRLLKCEGRLETSLGWVYFAFTDRGLSKLCFQEDASEGLRSDSKQTKAFCRWFRSFQDLAPERKWQALDLGGSDFQRSVWRALLEIPHGGTTTYGAIAEDLGRPRASRAVGSAVGANPVAILVPCHRVLPRTGKPGKYRWGANRKRALLDAERESGSDLQILI